MVSSTRRLAHHHRLEAPLERRVLLDVLAVLVERGRADAAQLAARERRLEHVGRVHRALGRAGADQRVQLVDEQDDAARAASISLSTAFRRSSNSPRNFEPATMLARSSARRRLSFSDSGTSPLAMRCAMPSTMAVLPTPGSPISTGLFLVRRESTCITRRISSSRPMTGSILPRRASSVRSRVYFSSAWNFPSGSWSVTRWLPRISASAREELVVREPVPIEDGLHVLVVLGGGEQEVLDRDEVVLEPLGFVLGLREQRREAPAEGRLGAARHLRQTRQALVEVADEVGCPGAGALDERTADAALLLEDGDQEVLRNELGIAALGREIDGGAQRFLALGGRAIHSHARFSAEGACVPEVKSRFWRGKGRPGPCPGPILRRRCARRCRQLGRAVNRARASTE